MPPRIAAARRRILAAGGALAASTFTPFRALAQAGSVDLPMANGHRNLAVFPEKRPMIVLTTRPPQPETPWEVFNEGLITPNDAFFVRYHNAGLPTSVDGERHTIHIGGNAVAKPFSVTVAGSACR